MNPRGNKSTERPSLSNSPKRRVWAGPAAPPGTAASASAEGQEFARESSHEKQVRGEKRWDSEQVTPRWERGHGSPCSAWAGPWQEVSGGGGGAEEEVLGAGRSELFLLLCPVIVAVARFQPSWHIHSTPLASLHRAALTLLPLRQIAVQFQGPTPGDAAELPYGQAWAFWRPVPCSLHQAKPFLRAHLCWPRPSPPPSLAGTWPCSSCTRPRLVETGEFGRFCLPGTTLLWTGN